MFLQVDILIRYPKSLEVLNSSNEVSILTGSIELLDLCSFRVHGSMEKFGIVGHDHACKIMRA